MLHFAEAVAHERGIECPEEVKSDFSACRKFLDEHAPERTPGTRGRSQRTAAKGPSASPVPTDRSDPAEDGVRRPTGPMIGFAQRLAQERGLKIPPGVLDSFHQCRAFLDQHRKPGGKRAGDRPPGKRPGADVRRVEYKGSAEGQAPTREETAAKLGQWMC